MAAISLGQVYKGAFNGMAITQTVMKICHMFQK
jgi:hypothetical protein